MRILILGAGYGGLALARNLDWWLGADSPHSITLVDRSPDHQIVVRLHEVAAASIPPEEALVPISYVLRGRRVAFTQAEVTGLDTAGRRVLTSAGDMPYDILAVALGGTTDFFGLPGVQEHALALKRLADAVRLRRHIEGQVVRAAYESDPERRRRRLTFVVGGGGFTGTEVAGELADRIRDLAAMHELNETPELLMLEAAEHLLPGFPPAAAARAAKMLADKGVTIRLREPVARAEPGRVILASGEEIFTETFIWAGGVRANAVVAESGLPVGSAGRARVDACLRWEGAENVFVIGDSALVCEPETGRPAAPSAQLAILQAERTARNLHRMLAGRPLLPFRGEPLAEVISLGRREALAMVGSLVVDGSQARRLKNLSYWRYQRSIGAWPLWAWYRPWHGHRQAYR